MYLAYIKHVWKGPLKAGENSFDIHFSETQVAMSKTNWTERNGRILVRHKEKKEDKTVLKSKAVSNFTFTPIIQVLGETNGYIMKIDVYSNEDKL